MTPTMADTETRLFGEILIVDDTPANLRLLSGMLDKQGYKVRLAPNSRLALKSAQAIPPDLILLDIRMPGMDGYEVCERLKADPRTRDTPIIFISALDQTGDKVKAFTFGGVDYVTKPFQVEEVLARVETHLALRHLHRQLQATNAELARRLEELEIRNEELQTALSTIKTLSGLVPICAWCGRKIQDDNGQWVRIEVYLQAHSEAEFTHGICPDCKEKSLDEISKLHQQDG
jgi:DNA-binding response OmpR family regulator